MESNSKSYMMTKSTWFELLFTDVYFLVWSTPDKSRSTISRDINMRSLLYFSHDILMGKKESLTTCQENLWEKCSLPSLYSIS